MNSETFRSILSVGETVAVEFKRCGNGVEHDTYESVCSFLNRFGGDLFLGVLDDGTVVGVPEKAAPDMIKNFISVISNDALFHPTVYLDPELLRFEGHTVIHIHVPPSSEVHSYKKTVYDRVDDADNTLMHREFVSSYTAKFVIMQDRMYTENANRAVKDGPITLENLEPTSKNPIIATFFRNIGRADRLGSGVRNLFKYSRFYSGSAPQFREGDVFRIIVPLNEAYSYDYKLGQERPDTVDTNFDTIDTIDTIPTFDLVSRNLTTEEKVVLELLTRDAALTQKQVQNTTGYSLSTVKRIMARLQKEGVITRIGNNRSGKWQVNG